MSTTGPLSITGAEVAPVTFGQLSLWRSEQEIPVEKRPEWHFSRSWPVPPGTALPAVLAALRALADRHESLRSTVDAGPVRPLQVVWPSAVAVFPVVVAAGRDGLTEPAAAAAAVALAARPFDLSAEPGWRAEVLPDGAGAPRYVCAAFHHFAVDQWALGVLDAEFNELVGAADPTAAAARMAAAPRPRDLAAEQQSAAGAARGAAAARYWRKLLAKYPRADGPAAMSLSQSAGRLRTVLTSPSLGAAFTRVAEASSVSPQAAVLAVTLEAVAEVGLRLDEPLILMAANRSDPRTRALVGTQNQAAALAIPDRGDDFAAYASAVEWAGLAAYRYGCYDFDEFTGLVRELRGAPLNYDYFFNHAAGGDDEPADEWTGPAPAELTVGPAPQSTGPRLDVRVYRAPGLTLDIRAHPDLLDEPTLEALARWAYDRVHTLAAAQPLSRVP
jgi:Condensation domain